MVLCRRTFAADSKRSGRAVTGKDGQWWALLLGLCGAEKGGRKGAGLYSCLYFMKVLLLCFGWIPRGAASKKVVEYSGGFREKCV